MRIALAAVLVVAACHKSPAPRAPADALWALAPDHTELGVVASPGAIALTARALTALRALVQSPDLAPARPGFEAVLASLLGSPTASFEDAGFTTARGFALFVTSDGVIGALPVGDRAKFVATKHGEQGAGGDRVNGMPCRPVRGFYVCATDDAMFDRLGKGALRGKAAALAGAPGDVEVYAPGLALLGGGPGDLAITARLTPGALDARARWTGTPGGVLAGLAGVRAPHPDVTGASGFVTLNLAPLLGQLPALPVAGGVTLDQLGKSVKGPVLVTIPAGTVDLEIRVPLSDPAPARTIIDHCSELQMFELAPTQQPGACRFELQATSAIEVDAWVAGDELRIGAHEGKPPAGRPGAVTAAGAELAHGDWTAAFWGRGSMLDLGGATPATGDLPAEASVGIHAIALVDELGVGVAFDRDGVRARAVVRTAWANPPDVVAKITAFSGNDIMHGTATAPAKAVAAAAPGSPFATDLAAGQGGLIVPAAAIGITAAVALPALFRYLHGGGGAATTAEDAAVTGPPQVQGVALLVRAYARQAYPAWAAAHAGTACPASLSELASYLDVPPDFPTLVDAWGQQLVMLCGKDLPPGARGLAVLSLGPDGKQGTGDDIRSW